MTDTSAKSPPLPSQIREEPPFKRLGHYQIIERIGAGGMGDVYRGYDESLDRLVAVKVLPAALARDEGFVRRFHAEATAAAAIAHPNVVPIYFIGEEGGHHFFAMQFVEGESLAERIAREAKLHVEKALELIGQCLAGLQAAHARGLIHRDIKPGNILLERKSGRAMLVDFGLVRRIGQSAQMTATGVIMGTVDYIAPEQARGRKVDSRVDIYSLGVLFYQLLSGRMPFTADSPTAMVFQHAYEPPFPLEEAVPSLPPPVVQIVERMMAKEPEHRYPDCVAASADLRLYQEGRPLASDGSAWAEASKLAHDELIAEPKLPEELTRWLSRGRMEAAKDWAATMFRRHAPEYLQQMQGTTQQADAAVAQYRRRRNRLAKLLDEAQVIESDLQQQIEANQSASAAAAEAAADASEKRRTSALARQAECEGHLEALRSQQQLQRQQVADLERKLGKADAMLGRLVSQQHVLKARLQAAPGRLVGVPSRPNLRRWIVLATAVAVVAVAALLLLPKPERPDAPPAATEDGALRLEQALARPPKPNPKVPPGAALLMSFDKNTIVEVPGLILRIHSLTGRNYATQINARYTPEGKVGGAISIEDGTEVRIPGNIINRQPEYTITEWIKRKPKERLWTYGETGTGAIFGINAGANGNIMVCSGHRYRINFWMDARTPDGIVPENQWVFVAVRLVHGERLNRGELTIKINDRSYARNLQMTDTVGNEYTCSIGAGNGRWDESKYGRGSGFVDELTVYQRALSDQEIETLYQMGQRGESLGVQTPPEAPVP